MGAPDRWICCCGCVIEEMRQLGATVALLLRAGEGPHATAYSATVGRPSPACGRGGGVRARGKPLGVSFLEARGDAFDIVGGHTFAKRPLRGIFSRALEKSHMQPLIRLPEHAPLPHAGEGLG
ncbi:hypothetical protein XAP412_960036 [Xanthomonas phaseoli pv. phaseoli]|uniref:Uncharacterized protein n=1 Tax=Xanthomonas campestris pv. phaseoli TaxID=317013 RepID=A0ABY1TZ55_XANCH|nr:hypothetical protein XAP6984_990037 [Xanthomonas phaseoli pv. phaseoli]SON91807.1 hypothetical protein XAP412_960036 [Xanthomonas phaseoli pv. phaseoli]